MICPGSANARIDGVPELADGIGGPRLSGHVERAQANRLWRDQYVTGPVTGTYFPPSTRMMMVARGAP